MSANVFFHYVPSSSMIVTLDKRVVPYSTPVAVNIVKFTQNVSLGSRARSSLWMVISVHRLSSLAMNTRSVSLASKSTPSVNSMRKDFLYQYACPSRQLYVYYYIP